MVLPSPRRNRAALAGGGTSAAPSCAGRSGERVLQAVGAAVPPARRTVLPLARCLRHRPFRGGPSLWGRMPGERLAGVLDVADAARAWRLGRLARRAAVRCAERLGVPLARGGLVPACRPGDMKVLHARRTAWRRFGGREGDDRSACGFAESARSCPRPRRRGARSGWPRAPPWLCHADGSSRPGPSQSPRDSSQAAHGGGCRPRRRGARSHRGRRRPPGRQGRPGAGWGRGARWRGAA